MKPVIFPYCCISKSIPLAFDESMSYLEQICVLINVINKAITDLNNLTELVNNLDEEFEDYDEKIKSLQNDIINNKLELTNLINNYYQMSQTNLNKAIKDLKNEIENITIENVDILNPTNGENENVEKVVDDIYNALRYGAITCNAFDNFPNLTCNSFDNIEMTAFEFDTLASYILRREITNASN